MQLNNKNVVDVIHFAFAHSDELLVLQMILSIFISNAPNRV